MSELGLPGEANDGHVRWPLFAPLIVGGVIAVVFLALRSPVASWIRGFLSDVPEPADFTGMSLLDRGIAPQSLRRTIVGRGKSGVAAVLGAPRTAAGARGKVMRKQPNFWNADTWYYPLDSRAQIAMAIRFRRGIAQDVAFLEAPKS